MNNPNNPIQALINSQGFAILDGGLASTLESQGYDLNHPLWSAKVLMESPQAVRQVHLDFLNAGADCITTSTYQASLPGFAAIGLSKAQGISLMRQSVALAFEARTQFLASAAAKDRPPPLVAAGIGPYGAYLADGSEYSGAYDLDEDGLYRFHKPRWHILADSPAHLLACETIPSRKEAHALLRLLRETPHRWAWLSFSCRDGRSLCDGSSLAEVARTCDGLVNVAGIGVNCTSPLFISDLVRRLRRVTAKPVVIYPNAGEEWDSITKSWSREPPPVDLVATAPEWAALGARVIGGCCRVGPEQIARLRPQLLN